MRRHFSTLVKDGTWKIKKTSEMPTAKGPIYIDNITRILYVDTTSTTTAKGKMRSVRALVASGNGKGAGGFAVGKGSNTSEALMKARKKSLNVNKWITIDMDSTGRLIRDSVGEFKGTKVLVRKVNEEKQGLTCSKLVYGICEVFGIKHITAKRLTRKRSPHTFCQAVFDALGKQTKLDSIELERGGRIDYSTANFNYNRGK